MEVGRVAWESGVNDADSTDLEIILQTHSCFLRRASAQHQTHQGHCSHAAAWELEPKIALTRLRVKHANNL